MVTASPFTHRPCHPDSSSPCSCNTFRDCPSRRSCRRCSSSTGTVPFLMVSRSRCSSSAHRCPSPSDAAGRQSTLYFRWLRASPCASASSAPWCLRIHVTDPRWPIYSIGPYGATSYTFTSRFSFYWCCRFRPACGNFYDNAGQILCTFSLAVTKTLSRCYAEVFYGGIVFYTGNAYSSTRFCQVRIYSQNPTEPQGKMARGRLRRSVDCDRYLRSTQ